MLSKIFEPIKRDINYNPAFHYFSIVVFRFGRFNVSESIRTVVIDPIRSTVKFSDPARIRSPPWLFQLRFLILF